MESKLLCAGLGGQGVLMIGQLLGYAATMDEEKQIAFFPSYGFEMRGGSADCYVVISDSKIGSVMFKKSDYAIVMSEDALKKYEDFVKPGGSLFVNQSMVHSRAVREDIHVYYIDAQRCAEEAGAGRGANIVMLGAFIKATGVLPPDKVAEALQYKFQHLSDNVKAANKKAFDLGQQMVDPADCS